MQMDMKHGLPTHPPLVEHQTVAIVGYTLLPRNDTSRRDQLAR
jgi:hypothetical protein